MIDHSGIPFSPEARRSDAWQPLIETIRRYTGLDPFPSPDERGVWRLAYNEKSVVADDGTATIQHRTFDRCSALADVRLCSIHKEKPTANPQINEVTDGLYEITITLSRLGAPSLIIQLDQTSPENDLEVSISDPEQPGNRVYLRHIASLTEVTERFWPFMAYCDPFAANAEEQVHSLATYFTAGY